MFVHIHPKNKAQVLAFGVNGNEHFKSIVTCD